MFPEAERRETLRFEKIRFRKFLKTNEDSRRCAKTTEDVRRLPNISEEKYENFRLCFCRYIHRVKDTFFTV